MTELNNTCTRHPEKNAVGKCESCGKNVCEECRVEYQGKLVCPVCLDEKTGIAETAISKSPESVWTFTGRLLLVLTALYKYADKPEPVFGLILLALLLPFFRGPLSRLCDKAPWLPYVAVILLGILVVFFFAEPLRFFTVKTVIGRPNSGFLFFLGCVFAIEIYYFAHWKSIPSTDTRLHRSCKISRIIAVILLVLCAILAFSTKELRYDWDGKSLIEIGK